MAADLAPTVGDFRHGPLVLSRQAPVADSPDFHLSALDDRHWTTGHISAGANSARRPALFVLETQRTAATGLLRRSLFRGFALSDFGLFQRIFFPLLVCERSFSISGIYRTAGAGSEWNYHLHGRFGKSKIMAKTSAKCSAAINPGNLDVAASRN